MHGCMGATACTAACAQGHAWLHGRGGMHGCMGVAGCVGCRAGLAPAYAGAQLARSRARTCANGAAASSGVNGARARTCVRTFCMLHDCARADSRPERQRARCDAHAHAQPVEHCAAVHAHAGVRGAARRPREHTSFVRVHKPRADTAAFHAGRHASGIHREHCVWDGAGVGRRRGARGH
eukprot:284421-Chlamydomonas_euryale.AAC.1